MGHPTPRDEVLDLIRRVKEDPSALGCAPPVVVGGRAAARLEGVGWRDLADPEAVALLASWRQAAADAFPAGFPVTPQGTRSWLVKQLLELPDRVLFWIKEAGGARVGHVGLYRFDWDGPSVEIDNVVRGVAGVLPGVMSAAVQALAGWAFDALGMDALFLRVFSDNERALRLYDRCGFAETMRMPLARVEDGDVVRWVEVDGNYRQPVSRYFVTMALPRARWLADRPPRRLAA